MINPSKYRHTVSILSRTGWPSSELARYALDEGAGLSANDLVASADGTVNLSDGEWDTLGLERTVTAAGTPLVTLPVSLAVSPIIEALFVVRPTEASTLFRILTPGPVVESSLTLAPATTMAQLDTPGGGSASIVNTGIVASKWLAVGAQINTTANTVKLRVYTWAGVFASASDTSTGIDHSDAASIEIMQSGKQIAAYVALFNAALSDDDWKRAAWLSFRAVTSRGVPVPKGLKSEEKDTVVEYEDIPARVTPLNGPSLVRARQIDVRITHKVEMREDADIVSPHTVLSFDGRLLEAVAPITVDEMLRETTFQARELVD